eukprot:CAMPEP_0179427456 /NCGR_PEP_ID=MMETSP0799-20121207/13402_1 /TAXON_ID=46947 /ORGANISM="Geminigera cryophila, Strain CCMP2564" /LENGTH=92 /DNA_ID=CAMNT_0021202517 /DNA_START=1739 /DNA_END=2018 /DNA_ORIENTATION=+
MSPLQQDECLPETGRGEIVPGASVFEATFSGKEYKHLSTHHARGSNAARVVELLGVGGERTGLAGARAVQGEVCADGVLHGQATFVIPLAIL